MENEFKNMENESTSIAVETKTADFDVKEHLANAALGALYYLIVYIPFILPFHIWGKAATRISLLWEHKSIQYNENKGDYPLYLFYFHYIINFIFDALMFLVWPIGLIVATYNYIDALEYANLYDGYIIELFTYYFSVISIRLAKETLFFVLNYLIKWLFSVIKNIGSLIKNMWLLNFVIRKK